MFVSQVTHRLQSNSSRYQVNIDSFNEKVDTINKLLFTDKKISFWYLKDFWGAGCKQDTICHDGVHLTEAGQQKLLKNIRAAVVSAARSLTQDRSVNVYSGIYVVVVLPGKYTRCLFLRADKPDVLPGK